ncbi:ComEA family DNA-binding protein [Paenibacillus pinihumi]|uniref:ComEA family DNA-binding protein n=1 Tax=Paenibacillus pinihumi TaxID=669462 RepID=UPI00040304ED|nr:ComEA family DNA-binding protein [Paenibacillus pinihumi]
MMHHKMSSAAISRWSAIGLLAAALLLLAVALWTRNDKDTEEWLRLDGQLGKALGAYEEPQSSASTSGSMAAGASGKIADSLPDKNAGAQSGTGLDGKSAYDKDQGAAGEGAVRDGGTSAQDNGAGTGEGKGYESNASHGQHSGDTPPPEPLVDAEGRLNLNKAQAEDLIALPGIGPAKAQAIVDERSRNGLFRSVEDITRVKGIGSKMLEKIKNSIVVYPGL